MWTETLEFWRLKVPNSRLHFTVQPLPNSRFCALFWPLVHGLCALRLFQAALDTCLNSPLHCQPLSSTENAPSQVVFGSSQKGGFQKGGFGGCSPGTKTGTRVRSPKPPFWKPPFYLPMTLFGVDKRVVSKRVVSADVPPERKPERGHVRQTTLLRNRPFISQWCLEIAYLKSPEFSHNRRNLWREADFIHVPVLGPPDNFDGGKSTGTNDCAYFPGFGLYSFLLSFILFSSLWTRTAVKSLNSRQKSWRQNSEKLWKSVEKVWKSAKPCEKCRDEFCRLVVTFSFSLKLSIALTKPEDRRGTTLSFLSLLFSVLPRKDPSN